MALRTVAIVHGGLGLDMGIPEVSSNLNDSMFKLLLVFILKVNGAPTAEPAVDRGEDGAELPEPNSCPLLEASLWTLPGANGDFHEASPASGLAW